MGREGGESDGRVGRTQGLQQTDQRGSKISEREREESVLKRDSIPLGFCSVVRTGMLRI